jgi:hypothetical protein
LDIHERLLKYLSEDLLAFLAIWGDNFAVSGRKVYYLKQRSGENVKSMNTAGYFYVWISSLVITLAGPAFVLFWVTNMDYGLLGENMEHVTSAVAPAAVTLIASLYIAQVFSGVFRGCISTSLVCFLADREMFIENQGFRDNEVSGFFFEKQHSNLSSSKVMNTSLNKTSPDKDNVKNLADIKDPVLPTAENKVAEEAKEDDVFYGKRFGAGTARVRRIAMRPLESAGSHTQTDGSRTP